MVAADELGEAPVRKTIRILSNNDGVLGKLDKRCEGGHRHVALVSGRPKAAAVYLLKLCEEMVAGFDLTRRGLSELALLSFLGSVEEGADLCDPADNVVKADAGHYWDDLKSEVLDAGLAKKARQEEVEVFRMRDVYELFPRSSVPRGRKVIGVRWVETNKGTAANPKVRSRLVAQEIARGKTPEDMYAPTPSLLATRWLLSEAASQGAHGPGAVQAGSRFQEGFLIWRLST